MPRVEIDGLSVEVPAPLTSLETVVSVAPMALMFVGGALGGLLGGAAAAASVTLLQRRELGPVRYLMSFGASAVAAVGYFMIASSIGAGIAPVTQATLATMAKEVNKQAPQMVDDVTRLDRAEAVAGGLAYHYTLVGVSNSDLPANLTTTLRDTLRPSVCGKKALVKVLRSGFFIEYEYVDETERVSPADAAMQGDAAAAPDEQAPATDEPEWRADAEAALNETDA